MKFHSTFFTLVMSLLMASNCSSTTTRKQNYPSRSFYATQADLTIDENDAVFTPESDVIKAEYEVYSFSAEGFKKKYQTQFAGSQQFICLVTNETTIVKNATIGAFKNETGKATVHIFYCEI